VQIEISILSYLSYRKCTPPATLQSPELILLSRLLFVDKHRF
jgi:hypothetical protein